MMCGSPELMIPYYRKNQPGWTRLASHLCPLGVHAKHEIPSFQQGKNAASGELSDKVVRRTNEKKVYAIYAGNAIIQSRATGRPAT
jgi:hypothetical protein